MIETAQSPAAPAAQQLGELLRRSLVSCQPRATVQQAAQLMAAADTGSIVVLGDGGEAVGIVTDSDLRRRVVAPGQSSGALITSVMSSPVLTVPPTMLSVEAVALMLEQRIHHLVVADQGRALGVVADSDLVAQFSSSPLFLERRIRSATSPGELALARSFFPEMTRLLLVAGVGAYDLARITAETTDRLVRRALELAHEQLGPPPLPYCWLGIGSEGRREQSLHTDQDHALVYQDPEPGQAELARSYFLRLAERMVAILVESGIPRCKGDAMASNPRWNQPLAAWQQQLGQWIERPEPEALLHASIFFDLRPVAGDAALGAALREQITHLAPRSWRFLMLLADDAAQYRPPLGFFRHLVVERSGEHRGALELKHGGIQPVVDLARLRALRNGISATNTIERLRALAAAGAVPDQEAADLVAAYEFLLLLRARRHLEQIATGQPTDNYVRPAALRRADRLLLKEYFGVIAGAQEALRDDLRTYMLR